MLYSLFWFCEGERRDSNDNGWHFSSSNGTTSRPWVLHRLQSSMGYIFSLFLLHVCSKLAVSVFIDFEFCLECENQCWRHSCFCLFPYSLSLVGSGGHLELMRESLTFWKLTTFETFLWGSVFCVSLKVIPLSVFTNCLMVQNGVLWMLAAGFWYIHIFFVVKIVTLTFKSCLWVLSCSILGFWYFFFFCMKDCNFDIYCYLAQSWAFGVAV